MRTASHRAKLLNRKKTKYQVNVFERRRREEEEEEEGEEDEDEDDHIR